MISCEALRDGMGCLHVSFDAEAGKGLLEGKHVTIIIELKSNRFPVLFWLEH